MLNQYYWAAIACLVVSLCGSGYLLKRAYVAYGKEHAEVLAKDGQIEALNRSLLRAQEQHTLDAATLTRLAAKNRATAREMASVQASLATALAANRAWADSAVPKEVQDALSK